MKNKIINIIKKTLLYAGILLVSMIILALIFGPETDNNLDNEEDIKVEQKEVLEVKNEPNTLKIDIEPVVQEEVKVLTKEEEFNKKYIGKEFTIDHKETFDVVGYKGSVNLWSSFEVRNYVGKVDRDMTRLYC